MLAPVLAGLLVGHLTRSDPRLALVGALLAFTTGPGWSPPAIAALALVWLGAAIASRARQRGFEPLAVAFGALPGVLVEPWLATSAGSAGGCR